MIPNEKKKHSSDMFVLMSVKEDLGHWESCCVLGFIEMLERNFKTICRAKCLS